MTTLLFAPTLLSAALIAAAVEAGLYPGRRVLITSCDAVIPEASSGTAGLEGIAALGRQCDLVVDLNELIAPYHPRAIMTDPGKARLAAAAIEDAVGGRVTAVVAPVHRRAFTRALATHFSGASVDAVADHRDAHGHGFNEVAKGLRVNRVLHTDLLPRLDADSVAPSAVELFPIPALTVLEQMRALAGAEDTIEVDEAWILGDDPGPRDACRAHADGVTLGALDMLVDAGFNSIAFKPHPNTSERYPASLVDAAAERSIHLAILSATTPAELLFLRYRPQMVAGRHTTALSTASAIFNLTTTPVGGAPAALGEQVPGPTEPSGERGPGRYRAARVAFARSLVGSRLRSARNVAAALWFASRL